jgi:hypothetical protein
MYEQMEVVDEFWLSHSSGLLIFLFEMQPCVMSWYGHLEDLWTTGSRSLGL